MEHKTHRLRKINTIDDKTTLRNDSLTLFRHIIKPELGTILDVTNNKNAGLRSPNNVNLQTLLDMHTNI
jgi:hypothetical protein